MAFLSLFLRDCTADEMREIASRYCARSLLSSLLTKTPKNSRRPVPQSTSRAMNRFWVWLRTRSIGIDARL